jgi:hypothetical protein
MVEPNLPARIEKTNNLACGRVGGCDPILFVIVAEGTIVLPLIIIGLDPARHIQ